MKKMVMSSEFGLAVCDVFGIDYKNHPITGVDVVLENGQLAGICVMFAVPYGLLTQIDARLAKVGTGGTAAG